MGHPSTRLHELSLHISDPALLRPSLSLLELERVLSMVELVPMIDRVVDVEV